MVREDTIICMDNSEWMRNGDYFKTRMEAQYQAIEYVLRLKTKNPENTVGLISLAGGEGHGVQVLCSPTKESFKVGRAAMNASIGGRPDLATGLKVAQLALKFRPQRSIQARVIVFIGSPLDSSQIPLLKSVGKQLKRNNIAVDIVSVGEREVNEEALKVFIKSVTKVGIACTLVVVPPGKNVQDAIEFSGMNPEEDRGGFDDEDDPFLAQALAESRAMAEAAAAAKGEAPPKPQVDKTSTTATEGESLPHNPLDEDDEDDIIKQAKLMSLLEENQNIDDKQKAEGTGGVGKALSEGFAKDLLNKAGVTDMEVEDEIKDLKKNEKKDDEKDKKN